MIPGAASTFAYLAPNCYKLTCSKIDYNVYEENGVRETIKHNPSSWKIVIKEGYGNRKYDKVGNQEQQHAEVPVKSEISKTWMPVVPFRKNIWDICENMWIYELLSQHKNKIRFLIVCISSDNKK